MIPFLALLWATLAHSAPDCPSPNELVGHALPKTSCLRPYETWSIPKAPPSQAFPRLGMKRFGIGKDLFYFLLDLSQPEPILLDYVQAPTGEGFKIPTHCQPAKAVAEMALMEIGETSKSGEARVIRRWRIDTENGRLLEDNSGQNITCYFPNLGLSS